MTATRPAETTYLFSKGRVSLTIKDKSRRVLGIDPERVFVELVSNGGAFGGKEDMSIQAQTALMAWLSACRSN